MSLNKNGHVRPEGLEVGTKWCMGEGGVTTSVIINFPKNKVSILFMAIVIIWFKTFTLCRVHCS